MDAHLLGFLLGIFFGSFGYRLWRNTRRGQNVNQPPTYAKPPAPPGPPPMADMTYGCHEHYYDGCPNCGRGKKKE